MATKLYVGNLAYSTDKETLQNRFSEYGTVLSANVITTGRQGLLRGSALLNLRMTPARKRLYRHSTARKLTDAASVSVKLVKSR